MFWKDDSQYNGEFSNNVMNGFGQRIFPDNIQFLNYTGYWKQGKMSGVGVLFAKSGSMYKGNLINDLKEGTVFQLARCVC